MSISYANVVVSPTGVASRRLSYLLLILLVSFIAEATIVGRPYLQGVTQNSVYVMVEGTTSDTAVVQYGLDTLYGQSARSERIASTTGATYVHKVKLEGLLTDTLYHFRASQGGSNSADATFRTAVLEGRSYRFAWIADNRTGTAVFDQITALVLAKAPAFFLDGGDVCADANYSTWRNEFFRPNNLQLIAKTPFFLSPGNHEGWGQNTQAFTKAPASPSGTEAYYSFDYGDMHVLLLNYLVSYAIGSPQYLFAQNDLAGSTRRWKVVVCHSPAYCSGGHGEDAGMKTMTTNIFEPHGVDFVFAGHSHFYQHNLVNQIHHFVIGTAGAPLTSPTNASYTLRSVRDYNYAIIDLTPTSFRMKVYSNFDAVLDSLVFTKPPSGIGEGRSEFVDFKLYPNYPNPFNPTTLIEYQLPERSHVVLKVFDILGREVATLVDRVEEPGYKRVRFDAAGLAGGVYCCTLRAGGSTQTMKLLVIR